MGGSGGAPSPVVARSRWNRTASTSGPSSSARRARAIAHRKHGGSGARRARVALASGGPRSPSFRMAVKRRCCPGGACRRAELRGEGTAARGPREASPGSFRSTQRQRRGTCRSRLWQQSRRLDPLARAGSSDNFGSVRLGTSTQAVFNLTNPGTTASGPLSSISSTAM
jgi:hypothetical protein